jgi:class 3 adenylate cyclase
MPLGPRDWLEGWLSARLARCRGSQWRSLQSPICRPSSWRQVATVFFSDVKGFSGLGELLTATTLVKLLNTYFSEMTKLIRARNGIIDKLIGDGLMAFWTAPLSRGDSYATDACLAALAQQDAIQKLREH